MAVASAVLGTIVKAVGLKGEVKLLPGPDFWSDALRSDGLELISEDSVDRRVQVDGCRRKGATFILKLSGVETINDAESLVGCRLRIELDGVPDSLMPESPLPFQLIGMEVRLRDGSVLGTVDDLLLGSQQNCLIVRRMNEKYLVPDAPGVISSIDLAGGVIEIDPPRGLLDLRW